jgi:hypothetical protein
MSHPAQSRTTMKYTKTVSSPSRDISILIPYFKNLKSNFLWNYYRLKTSTPLIKICAVTFCNVAIFYEPEPEKSETLVEEKTKEPKLLVAKEFEKAENTVKEITLNEHGEIVISINELPVDEEIPKPVTAKPSISSPTSLTMDEEDCLWNLSQMYSMNWELIACAISAFGFPSRSPWEYYEAYRELKRQKFVPSVKEDYLYYKPTRNGRSAQADSKSKALRLLGTFEQIKKCAKKRDSQKVPCQFILT